jgi:carbonic anhydrase
MNSKSISHITTNRCTTFYLSKLKSMQKTIMLFAFFVFGALCSKAQISVTASAGTPGPTAYTTLNAAFVAINAGTHQGIINIAVTSNTTETGPCVLNSTGAGSAVYTSIVIKPTVAATNNSSPLF